jgi:hypothetical protein
MGSSRISQEDRRDYFKSRTVKPFDVLAISPRGSGTIESNLVSNSTNCIIVQVLTQTTNH